MVSALDNLDQQVLVLALAWIDVSLAKTLSSYSVSLHPQV